jgi:hypothetical protein
MNSLDQILDLLNQYHQRATYGRRRGPGWCACNVSDEWRPRDWRHSWVVDKETKRPTEYASELVHPAIDERREILNSGEQLEAWLKDPR